jgi:hypothetical protein
MLLKGRCNAEAIQNSQEFIWLIPGDGQWDTQDCQAVMSRHTDGQDVQSCCRTGRFVHVHLGRVAAPSAVVRHRLG